MRIQIAAHIILSNVGGITHGWIGVVIIRKRAAGTVPQLISSSQQREFQLFQAFCSGHGCYFLMVQNPASGRACIANGFPEGCTTPGFQGLYNQKPSIRLQAPQARNLRSFLKSTSESTFSLEQTITYFYKTSYEASTDRSAVTPGLLLIKI